MDENLTRTLQQLPSVSEFLASDSGRELAGAFGHEMTKIALNAVLDDLRREITNRNLDDVPETAEIRKRVQYFLRRRIQPEGRQAVNATGILLHTGLGRAPLCTGALDALSKFGTYSVLQTSLDTGTRCLREEKIEEMLRMLTGCEAATVVNNNAAATMLILNTLCAGREVVISRGQLVEIGGAFRMPDVMERSNAVLRETGTTNRTHLRDYEACVSERTGAFMHVHTSNYRIRGFGGTPGIRELCTLADKHGVPAIDDLGSGALVPLSEFGLPDEPLVRDSIAAGADVVCFSGDKLISGPQSGIICGKKGVISRIRKNPYARMFRVCKMTLAALESTLNHFINRDYKDKIPFYRMLGASLEQVQERAETLVNRAAGEDGIRMTIRNDLSYIGSGSLPDQGIPTKVVVFEPPADRDATEIARGLRRSIPSVFCRIKDGALVFDMRTILDHETEFLAQAIHNVYEQNNPS